MTVYLRPPEYSPGGPDGAGWNRLSLNAHMHTPAGQCALRPRTHADLWMLTHRGTMHAQWGNHGRCTNPEAGDGGGCRGCPTLDMSPLKLQAFSPRMLVRVEERVTPVGALGTHVTHTPHIMNRAEDGWGSRSEPTTWERLARLVGWTVDRRHSDEHSDGFWLAKVNPEALDGRPSPCPHEYLNPDFCNQGCKVREYL